MAATNNNTSSGGAAVGETEDLTSLHAEIERLSRELDQASSEKVQSAKYGLGLLDEKSQLQSRCEELEVLYENARHELDITQEVRVGIMRKFELLFIICIFRIGSDQVPDITEGHHKVGHRTRGCSAE